METHTLINYLLAVGGIVLSIIFYFRGKHKKSPAFEKTSTNIISESIAKNNSNIEVQYKNVSVKTLTATKVALWNAGNSTIFDSDVPESNRFRIELSEENVLYEYEIISFDKDSLIDVVQNGNILFLNFKFLEPSSGCVVKIIHSGLDSDCLSVLGKVIGGDRLERIDDFSRNAKTREAPWKDVAAMIGIALAIYLLYKSSLETLSKVVFALMFITLFCIAGYKLLQRRVPKSLKNSFYQD